MPETAVEFVDRPGLFAVPVHTEIGGVRAVYILASFSRVLFGILPSAPHVTTTSGLSCCSYYCSCNPRGYETYGVGLQEPLSQHLVTCGSDGEGLEENLDIADLDKLPPEYLARLSQTVTSS